MPHHNHTNTSHPQTFFWEKTLYLPESQRQSHQHKAGDLTQKITASPLEIRAQSELCLRNFQSILADNHEFTATMSRSPLS